MPRGQKSNYIASTARDLIKMPCGRTIECPQRQSAMHVRFHQKTCNKCLPGEAALITELHASGKKWCFDDASLSTNDVRHHGVVEATARLNIVANTDIAILPDVRSIPHILPSSQVD